MLGGGVAVVVAATVEGEGVGDAWGVGMTVDLGVGRGLVLSLGVATDWGDEAGEGDGLNTVFSSDSFSKTSSSSKSSISTASGSGSDRPPSPGWEISGEGCIIGAVLALSDATGVGCARGAMVLTSQEYSSLVFPTAVGASTRFHSRSTPDWDFSLLRR